MPLLGDQTTEVCVHTVVLLLPGQAEQTEQAGLVRLRLVSRLLGLGHGRGRDDVVGVGVGERGGATGQNSRQGDDSEGLAHG